MTELNRTLIQTTFKKLAEHILCSFSLSVPKNVCVHFMDLMFPLDSFTDDNIIRKIRTVLFFMLGNSSAIMDKEIVRDLISIIPSSDAFDHLLAEESCDDLLNSDFIPSTLPEDISNAKDTKILPDNSFMCSSSDEEEDKVSFTGQTLSGTQKKHIGIVLSDSDDEYSSDSFLTETQTESDVSDERPQSAFYRLMKEDGTFGSSTNLRTIS